MSGPGTGGGQYAIRRATADEAAVVAEVFLAARAGMDYLPRPHTDDETRWWIEHVVLDQCEVWVAESSGRTAGFTALRGEWLDHLYVDPSCQGAGVGEALLEVAKRERPGGLHLHVFQQNTGAVRFYERHGFALVELGDGSGNDERLPDAHYRWQPRASRT